MPRSTPPEAPAEVSPAAPPVVGYGVGDSGHPGQPHAVPVYLPNAATSGVAVHRSVLSRVFTWLLTTGVILSILLNVYLLVILAALQADHETVYSDGDDDSKIALIPLVGSINMKTAAEIRVMLNRAAEDDNVFGVIFVVNSPGGQVVPSDKVNRYIREFRQETAKPVYVSIEQVGASGAYWISAAAERIYAETNAMIGSIGVIYINLVLEQALKEKLGITPVIVKSSKSPFKDHNSPFRMPTEDELADIRDDLDTIHSRFVKVISTGREMSLDDVWSLADGDVHDGPDALSKGLIDKIGSLDDVIADMSSNVGLTNPTVVQYEKPKTLQEKLFGANLLSNNPLDIQKQLENFAMSPRVMAIWLGK